jgi:hypothetical protein
VLVDRTDASVLFARRSASLWGLSIVRQILTCRSQLLHALCSQELGPGTLDLLDDSRPNRGHVLPPGGETHGLRSPILGVRHPLHVSTLLQIGN